MLRRCCEYFLIFYDKKNLFLTSLLNVKYDEIGLSGQILSSHDLLFKPIYNIFSSKLYYV